MEVEINGHHIEITEALETRVENKLSRLKKYLDGRLKCWVMLSVDGPVKQAEIAIHAAGYHMHATEKSPDMYGSIDASVDKIERQLKRYKERLQNHRLSRHVEEMAHLEMTVDTLSGPELEEGLGQNRVIHTRRLAVKPMTADEAVMQMDLLHQEFLVYRDAGSGQIHVLYRRQDGDYVLIQPEI